MSKTNDAVGTSRESTRVCLFASEIEREPEALQVHVERVGRLDVAHNRVLLKTAAKVSESKQNEESWRSRLSRKKCNSQKITKLNEKIIQSTIE